MSDKELLSQAVLLLSLLERNYDPHRDCIVITKQAWLDLTRDFRDRMAAEQHRRIEATRG